MKQPKDHRVENVLPLLGNHMSMSMTKGIKNEGSRHGLPYGFSSDFHLGSVKNLEELGCPCSHSRVHVHFGAFDVVVKVVAEQLDVRYRGFGGIWFIEVSREEN